MSSKRKQRVISDKELLDLLRKKRGKKYLKDYAKELGGVSYQYVAKVLKGIMPITDRIAKALGYRPVISYEAIPKKASKPTKPKAKAAGQGK